jgi:hypothetical protein
MIVIYYMMDIGMGAQLFVPRDFVRKCKNAKKCQLEAQEMRLHSLPIISWRREQCFDEIIVSRMTIRNDLCCLSTLSLLSRHLSFYTSSDYIYTVF